jgi:ankyrin repeat protein
MLSARFSSPPKDPYTRDGLVGIIRSSSNSPVSPRELKKQIKSLPQVLTTADRSYGWTPLHWACHTGAPLSVIQTLLHLGPKAASMANVSGHKPLHVLCQDRETFPKTLRVLVNAYPEALTQSGDDGHTPLHFACRYLQDESLEVVLERCPSQVLAIKASNGYTPFHYACEYGVPSYILKRMIRSRKKALLQTNLSGATCLHLACRSSRTSFQVIQVLVKHCPVLCLMLDHSSASNIPLELAVQWDKSQKVKDIMLQATRDATLALLVCVPTMPASVRTHIQTVLLAAIPELSQDSFKKIHFIETVKPHLDPATIKSLLDNQELQDLLQAEKIQDLVCRSK